jgi:hypothetical protein
MNVATPTPSGGLLPILSLLTCMALPGSLIGCGFSPDDDDSNPTIWDEVPVGALVITEILANPNVSRPEFVELQNASDATVSLQACQVADGGASAHEFVLNVPVDLEPGQRALLSPGEYLGSAEGEIVPDALWDGIVLNQGDETESFTISCPDGIGGRQLIDTVAFDWGALGVARGRSWQLAIEPDSIANDDPANWCPAPAQDHAIYAEVDGVPDYGSPGAPSTCETLGGSAPSLAGDVVISEILIHEFDGLREWFELYNPKTEAVDIRNCVLTDEAPGSGSDPNSHTLDYEAGSTVIEAGGFLLLSRTETDITSDGSVVADHPYSQLSFTNSQLQRLSLDCPSGDALVRIDEVTYDWSERASVYRGYSLSLSSGALTSEANNNPDNWCVGSDAYFTVTTGDDPLTTLTAFGSPGTANPSCPEPGPYPAAGELVITELLVDTFTGIREWIELYNPGATELDLFGCELVDVPVADSLLPESQNRHRITPEGGETNIAAGGHLLLSKTATDISDDGSIVADYAYTVITLNNSDEQYLWLECPGGSSTVEVDRVEYDWGNYSSADKGASLSLDRSTYSATDNDLTANWCLAQSSELYYSTTTADVPPVTYNATGTPGAFNSTCQ